MFSIIVLFLTLNIFVMYLVIENNEKYCFTQATKIRNGESTYKKGIKWFLLACQ
jgi:hypothetical protein